MNRPELTQMLEFVREGDHIYVHSMDRLARNLEDLRQLVLLLNNKGVSVHFVKESLIFTGEDAPMPKLILSVMGAIAEFERALINERQRKAIAIAKKSNKYKGRKKVFNDEQVFEIKQLVADRYKVKDIAVKFGVSRKTIYEYLKQ